MVWQRVDDQFGVSKKVTRIPPKQRLAAVGLWELASNYSARESTDGLLDAAELESVLATRPLVAELVRVELWHGPSHRCEHCVQPPVGGIVIHDFLEYIEPVHRKRPWIPERVREAVMARDGYRCVFCSSTARLSLDHIVRFRHGGSDEIDNLRVLCMPCNVERG